MLDSLNRSVSNPVSASCQNYLRIYCTVGDLPDFLTDSFYMINSDADSEDLRYYLLEEEVIIQEDINKEGLFQVPEEYLHRRLVNLFSLSKGARGSSLMIATAGQLNMRVESCNLDEFLTVMGIQIEKHNQIDNIKNLNIAHYVLAASMIMNLMGKNVQSVLHY